MSSQASGKNPKARRRRKAKNSWRSKRPANETLDFNPLQFFRPNRICALLDIDKSTLWRWRQKGLLPPFTKVAGIEGLTGEQLQAFLAECASNKATAPASAATK